MDIVVALAYSTVYMSPRNRRSKHGPQVLRGPIKSAEQPTIRPKPTTGHNVIR